MAGFDFTYETPLDQRLLGQQLLRRAQLIARNLDLEFRFARQDAGWAIEINGSLPSMQAFIPRLAGYIRPFADGCSDPPSRARRLRAAERLINAYCDGVAATGERIDEIADQLGSTSHSYFLEIGRATHLAGQTDEFAQTLILFHNGLISASQVSEEAHTMAEALLKDCVNRSNRLQAFHQLVNLAAPLAMLDSQEIDALVCLKDLRKKSKHKGQRVPFATLSANFPLILSALHKLGRCVRTRTDGSSTG